MMQVQKKREVFFKKNMFFLQKKPLPKKTRIFWVFFERSFSRHFFIHSAKRNRLTTDRAAKLVFIGQNLALGNVDSAHHEYIAASSTVATQPQPSSSSSRVPLPSPTFQIESDSGTEDSEGSIDDPSSTHSIMDISFEDSEEEEQQEPQ